MEMEMEMISISTIWLEKKIHFYNGREWEYPPPSEFNIDSQFLRT